MDKIYDYLDYSKLVVKSVLETAKINARLKSSVVSFDDGANPISVFFILSLGRSGTQFFSRLLNLSSKTMVLHEPSVRDVLEYARSFDIEYDFDAYIKNFKIRYILSNVSNASITVYGEVNSMLRRHAEALIANIPNAKGLYLIRDGRNVVRSMMSRGAMSNHWFYNKIIPHKEDPYYHQWNSLSRFEKCCWVWASENSRLYNQFGPAMKFEYLLQDFEYFKLNMLDALALDISKDTWEQERLVKSENSTTSFACDPYNQWSPEWKDAFWKICGDIMQKHEYSEYMDGALNGR